MMNIFQYFSNSGRFCCIAPLAGGKPTVVRVGLAGRISSAILKQLIVSNQQPFYFNMTLLSDEGVFSVSKIIYTEFLSEKKLKELDRDKIDEFKRLYIKPLYPHKQITANGYRTIEKYDCCEYCCELNPGRFCCCNSTTPDPAYREFGLGVCLYTKFLKHLTIFLFFMSILAMASIALYEIVSIQTGYQVTESYHNALFSTTLGVLSSEYVKCGYSSIDINNTAQFNLSCPVGKLQPLEPVFTKQTLSTLSNCRSESMKMHAKIYLPSYSNTITNNSAGSLDISTDLTTNIYEGATYNYLAYNYQCVEQIFTIDRFSLGSSTILYIGVGIDVFIIVCFLLFLISENKAEQKQISNFKMRELAVHDFTVKLSGFHLNSYERDLAEFINRYDELRRSKETAWDPKINGLLNHIVQVKIPEVEEIKEALEDRRGYYEELYELMDLCFLQDGIDLYRYKNAEDFIKKCYGSSESSEYIAYKQQLSKLVDKFMESKKIGRFGDDIGLSLLLVLSNPREKKQMFKMARTGCFGPYIKIKERKFYVSEPPVADMIIWENKNSFTCMRVIISWLITLGFFVGSYLLIAYATFKKQQLLNNNQFNVGCSILYKNNQLQSWQEALYNANFVYMHCYCNYNYFSLSYADTDMRTKCSKWFNDYIVYQGIPILISLGIILYNIVVDRIFRVLSKFEAHQYLSTELYSYIIKRSLMLILNMGLIIILIKLSFKNTPKIDQLSFLFQGTYNDITSDWYMQIGVIIILTLAFNIVIPIADMILVSFLKCIRKCVDRRCYCVKTSQKTKKGYMQLYLNDVFPIESRYSDFIAMIFITLAFSSVMPILYVIAFLSIWFMFVCDKLLLFRVYQKPINYSEDLQNKVFKLMYIAIMVHCVSSFFILSEKYLFTIGTSSFSNTDATKLQDISRVDFVSIIKAAPYLLAYPILFVIMGGWGVFHTFVVKFISYCISKCSKQSGQAYKSKLNRNFYSSLNQYQINRLKMSLEMQLHSNVDLQKTNLILKNICLNSIQKLKEMEKINQRPSKNMQLSEDGSHIKLIGKAGYDEMFDEEAFHREKKIKSLDYQFEDVFRRERALRRASTEVEQTLESLVK